MSEPRASITIASRNLALSLKQLYEILGGAELANSEARYKQAILRHWTIRALRADDPASYPDVHLGEGAYWLVIRKDVQQLPTLVAVLIAAARWLHDEQPDALLRLSGRRKHTRAYIAQDPIAIYGGRRRLATYAKLFAPNWYVDTNLSKENTSRFLNDLFTEAGLTHRHDWFFKRGN